MEKEMATAKEISDAIMRDVKQEIAASGVGQERINVQGNVLVEIDSKTQRATAVEYIGPGGKKARINEVVTEHSPDKPGYFRVTYVQENAGIKTNSCICCFPTPTGPICVAWPCDQPCP